MPGDTQVTHPSLNNYNITFREDNHTYIDNFGSNYTSVTTLISYAFEKFDSKKIAAKCAEKRGCTAQELIDEWAAKGKEAARLGTRLHENMEHYIHNEPQWMWEPEDITEKIKFDSAIQIIQKIKEKYHPQSMEPEKLVFSPDFLLAGSIDLLVKIDEMNYIIFDWKCLNKDLEKVGFNNKCGIILPTFNIPDSNYWHYALQLQIYENLLKSENYVNPKANFKKALIAWNGVRFNIEKIDYIPEAWSLMLWKQKIK